MAQMLLNPGFEDGFYAQGDDGNVTIGKGWKAGHDASAGKRPEFKPEKVGVGQGHVRTGTYAQKWFNTYSARKGWMWQKVGGFTPGKYYKFTGHVWVWSSGSNHNGTVSSPPTGKDLVQRRVCGGEPGLPVSHPI